MIDFNTYFLFDHRKKWSR